MNAIIFVYDSILKEKWEKKGKEIKNKERHHLCIIVLIVVISGMMRLWVAFSSCGLPVFSKI